MTRPTLALAVVLALAAAVPAAAQEPDPALPAEIDRLAEAQIASSGFPGLVVGIDTPDRGRRLRAYGLEIPGYNAIVLHSPQRRASIVVLGTTAPAIDQSPQHPDATPVADLALRLFAALDGEGR